MTLVWFQFVSVYSIFRYKKLNVKKHERAYLWPTISLKIRLEIISNVPFHDVRFFYDFKKEKIMLQTYVVEYY